MNVCVELKDRQNVSNLLILYRREETVNHFELEKEEEGNVIRKTLNLWM